MVDAREMKKILRNNGYEYQRCKGSHFIAKIVGRCEFMEWNLWLLL